MMGKDNCMVFICVITTSKHVQKNLEGYYFLSFLIYNNLNFENLQKSAFLASVQEKRIRKMVFISNLTRKYFCKYCQ